jgi:hypothetical protein
VDCGCGGEAEQLPDLVPGEALVAGLGDRVGQQLLGGAVQSPGGRAGGRIRVGGGQVLSALSNDDLAAARRAGSRPSPSGQAVHRVIPRNTRMPVSWRADPLTMPGIQLRGREVGEASRSPSDVLAAHSRRSGSIAPAVAGTDRCDGGGHQYGLGVLYGDRLRSVGTLCGADGVVVSDGEVHEYGHFGHGGVDAFQVPDGEVPVLDCVGSFEVAFGAVEQG